MNTAGQRDESSFNKLFSKTEKSEVQDKYIWMVLSLAAKQVKKDFY